MLFILHVHLRSFAKITHYLAFSVRLNNVYELPEHPICVNKTVSNVIEKLEHGIHYLPCSYTNGVMNLSSFSHVCIVYTALKDLMFKSPSSYPLGHGGSYQSVQILE